jgi:hypothetical protein
LFQERNTGPITNLNYDRYFYKNKRIMDSIETIHTVREDLAEIENILVWMEKSKEIHQVDIDVLLKKTRQLYIQVINLPVGRFEIQTEAVATAVAEAVRPIPASAPEAKPEPEPQPEQPQPSPPPQPIKEPPVREPEPEEIPVPVREPEPVPEPVWIPQPEPVREPAAIFPPYQPKTPNPEKPLIRETIAERNLFQRDGSLNDALGKQKPVHDVASSITDVPIADIWSAITINERFLFIRELFGNDPEGFKNTVTLLNSLGSWEAAKKFMTDRFEWDKNNPVAVDFLNVVRRRFL